MASSEKGLERFAAKALKDAGFTPVKLALLAGPGFPDHTVFLGDGGVAFVEYKTPTGRFGPLQKHWLKKLHKLGFATAVCRSRDDVRAVIEKLADPDTPRGEIVNEEIFG